MSETDNEVLRSNSNDAYRMLMGLAQNPAILSNPRVHDLNESSVVANMSPQQRDTYNQLLRQDPRNARIMLMTTGLQQATQ